MCPVQFLCFSSEAYASYNILMYMSSYEYEICRPFSVHDILYYDPVNCQRRPGDSLFVLQLLLLNKNHN